MKLKAEVAQLKSQRKQMKLDGYKVLFSAAAERCLDSEPNESIAVFPGTLGDAVILLLEAHRMAGGQRYLARADTLLMALLELWAAKNKPGRELGLVWLDR